MNNVEKFTPRETSSEMPQEEDAEILNFEHQTHDKIEEDLDAPGKDQEIANVQKNVLERLQRAANSEARVHTFAKLVDTYGLDAIVGLIPELGDAGASTLAGIYLLFEANRAGLDKTSYLKIIGLQTADFFVGAIPVVGDAADFLFKATKWSESSFKKKTEELVAEAKEHGIPDTEIAKITETSDKLPQLIENVIHFANKKASGQKGLAPAA